MHDLTLSCRSRKKYSNGSPSSCFLARNMYIYVCFVPFRRAVVPKFAQDNVAIILLIFPKQRSVVNLNFFRAPNVQQNSCLLFLGSFLRVRCRRYTSSLYLNLFMFPARFPVSCNPSGGQKTSIDVSFVFLRHTNSSSLLAACIVWRTHASSTTYLLRPVC